MDNEPRDVNNLVGDDLHPFDEMVGHINNGQYIESEWNIFRDHMERQRRMAAVRHRWISLVVDWERQRKIVVALLLCHIVHAVHLMHMHALLVDNPLREKFLDRNRGRKKLLDQLTANERTCREIVRMGPQAFLHFCQLLRERGHIKDFRLSTVEEQVAKFLHILGQDWKYRPLKFYWSRSTETVSRHFHNVLRAVISLESEFLRQPTGSDVSPQVMNNPRFYPFFKDCVGAIDGTHVRVKVSRADAPRYRGRKDWPTQNVLACCEFDMKFTYVLAGWEGTASDSRIFKNALTREDKLVIPRGKFYLGDAGFPLRTGLLTPYRGVRYHLKEYSRRGPQNAKELYNHRHASLRNVIERAFGVLKKRFPIISSGNEPHHSCDTMTEIILACCIIHNFLMGVDPDENMIDEVDRDLLQEEDTVADVEGAHTSEVDYRQAVDLRDSIAQQMWEDYQGH